MDRTHQVVRAARRRLLAASLLDRLGVWLTIGAGAGLLLAAAGRLLGLAAPWWALAAGPMAIGGLVAAGVALLGRESRLAAASRVDIALGLRDRLSTAVAFEGVARARDAFVDVARADAETTAAGVVVKRAAPMRLSSWWWIWPVLGTGAVAAGVFVPELNLLHPSAPTAKQVAAKAKARDEAGAQIKNVAEEVRREAESSPADSKAAEKLAALEEIERELRSGARTPEEARQAAAKTVSEVAEQMSASAQASRRETDALREQLARAGGGQAPAGEADSRLTRSLRQGDLARARAAADELSAAKGEMKPEDRAAAAEAMERYAKDLEDLAKQAERKSAEAAEGSKPPGRDAAGPSGQLSKELRDQGLSEAQAKQAAQERDVAAAEKSLEDAGVDPETARRLSEKLAEEKRERDAQEQAKREAEKLAKDLRDAAKSLREPEQDQAQGNGRNGEERNQQAKREQGQKGGGGEKSEGEGQKQNGAGDQQRDRTGERRQGAETKPGADKRPGAKGDGQKDPGSEPGGKPRPDASGQGDASKSGDQKGDQPAQQQPGAQGEQPTNSEGGQKPVPGQEPGGQPSEGGKSGGEVKPGPDGKQQDKQGAAAGERPGADGKPTPSADGQGRDPKAGDKPGTVGEKPPAGQHDDQGGEKRPDGAIEPKPGMKPGGAPNEKSADSPSDGVKKLAQRLRQMAETEKSAQRDQRTAEQLRERAREMYENADPEMREQMQKWAREMARQNPDRAEGHGPDGGFKGPATRNAPKPHVDAPGDYTTEVVDARRDKGDRSSGQQRERVVAEWLGDGKTAPDPSVSREEVEGQLMRAAQSAERAVDERVVHSRYDKLLRRYFRRLPENVVPGGGEPPVQSAKDAP